jgi:hypothetical protein
MRADPEIAKVISEKELAENVRFLSASLGWKHYHTWNSIHSAKGFPDCCLVKPPRLLFVELKREAGKIATAQQEWLDAIKDCGIETYVWRPTQWLDGTIERILKGE